MHFQSFWLLQFGLLLKAFALLSETNRRLTGWLSQPVYFTPKCFVLYPIQPLAFRTVSRDRQDMSLTLCSLVLGWPLHNYKQAMSSIKRCVADLPRGICNTEICNTTAVRKVIKIQSFYSPSCNDLLLYILNITYERLFMPNCVQNCGRSDIIDHILK